MIYSALRVVGTSLNLAMSYRAAEIIREFLKQTGSRHYMKEKIIDTIERVKMV